MDQLEQLRLAILDLNHAVRDLLAELRGRRQKEAYSVSEVAHLLSRSEWTIRRWVREGTIHGAHTGKSAKSHIVIPRWEVERLLSPPVGD